MGHIQSASPCYVFVSLFITYRNGEHKGEAMAAKVHKTLRLDESLVKRIEGQRKEGEAFSLTVNRVLAVGCDTMEGVTRNINIEHADLMAERTTEHDKNTQKVISLLEAENARLLAEHEADRAAIADKDAQLATALAKAHDLAEQAHVLTGAAQVAGKLPSANDGEIVDVTPPTKIGFWDWWKNYR